MANIFDSRVRAALEVRVQALRPDTSRQWGRMSPHQTICHLSDSFKVALGERSCTPRPAAFVTMLKFIALYAPLAWPKGRINTVPEVEQGLGGTPPGEFEHDRAELLTVMRRFSTCPSTALHPTHPIFGGMTARDWGRWGYRHVDHHLRQFGV